jgi:REP element-mobilizing transposase RayT
MRLNAAGKIVQLQWTTLPERFSRLRLDQFVIMPNHIHGILILTEEAPENKKATHPKRTGRLCL